MKQTFLKSEFSKNAFVLFGGTVLAQALPLILQPFLRRMYSPEDFGAMAVYLSIFGILTIVSSLRYESTIVLPEKNEEAVNIVALTFIINIIFNAILFLVILPFKHNIAQFIGLADKYAHYLYFLPLAGFFYGAYQSLNYWLIRQKLFKASSVNKIIRRGVEGVVQIVSALLKFPSGLLAGDVFGNMSNFIGGIRQVFKGGFDVRLVQWHQIKFVFKKYIDYPKYNVVPTLLSSIATVLPFLLVNKFYSTETVGYVDLSRMVLSIPLIFISTSISQVLFQQITEKKHKRESIKKDILSILYTLLLIVALEALVIWLWGPQLFAWVFGDVYSLSGGFSQILIFCFAINFIGSTFSCVFISFDKIKLNALWQVIHFSSICGLIFFRNANVDDFLLAYAIIESFVYILYCTLVFFIVLGYEKKIMSLK